MDQPHTTALVFATDEVFAPLAKGLVLSIVDNKEIDVSLCMVDIGCSDASLAWMRAQGATIRRFDRQQYFAGELNWSLKPYQDAQLCRPFLRALFPGHEIYLWCDSDLWIQDADSLELYQSVARESTEKVPLSPQIDVSYGYHYTDGMEFMRYAKEWYGGCYGPTIAATYADKAILNSGLFALHKDNPIWALWAEEISRIHSRNFSSHDISHLAEQTALSYLVYSRAVLVPVEALHNYNCHVGCARRREGQVVIDIPPYRKLGVIHLTYSSKMLPQYVKNGLLYRKGDYLSPSELSSLSRIAHY